MVWLIRFFRDEDGVTAVEYAVMLALMIMAMMASITSVGSQTGDMWETIDTEYANAAAGGGS